MGTEGDLARPPGEEERLTSRPGCRLSSRSTRLKCELQFTEYLVTLGALATLQMIGYEIFRPHLCGDGAGTQQALRQLIG